MLKDESRPARKRGYAGSLNATSTPVPTAALERQLLDGWLLERRVSLFAYYQSVTLLPTRPGQTTSSLYHGQEFWDAADECQHGALPTDRRVTCGCWEAYA